MVKKVKLLDFNPGMAPDTTMRLLDIVQGPLRVWRRQRVSLKVGEAKVGKREGISMGRRFAEKHLGVTTRRFFLFFLS